MRTVAALVMSALLAISGRGQQPAPPASPGPAESWFLRPLTDWNSGATEIPKEPPSKTPEQEWARCSSVRRPANANEGAAVEAGWHLSGVARTSGKMRVVRVAGGLDEMCHPVDYQALVFQGKQFVGALSPVPMNTRAEGDLSGFVFPADNHIVVDVHGYAIDAYFSHYAANDPACCPSMTVLVHYSLAGQGASLHLVAKAAVLLRNAAH